MSYQGSYATSSIVYFLFATTVNGLPITLAGAPAVSVYKNSTTQSTAGVTLTVDYDGVTGQNQIRVDTSADTAFYVTQTMYSVVISTGTVGGVSVVGRPVGYFSINAESLQAVTNITGTVLPVVEAVVSNPPRQLGPTKRGGFGVP